MHVSQKGIDLITEFEGFSAKAYKDPGSANGLPITIGYGTTKIDGRNIQLGDKITEAEARKLLMEHLVSYEDMVLKSLGAVTVNQNQFDALVSLVYNIGITQFNKSTVKRKILAGDMIAAANAFGMWVKNDGQVMAGLVRRRSAEQALFLAPEEPVQPQSVAAVSPSSALTPSMADKPLIKSKEIAAGGATVVGGVVTAFQAITVEDLVAAQKSVKDTKAEVQADKSIIGHNYIVQGASLLFILLGFFIIYKRIMARVAGHR
jgi:lysozyme